MTKTLNHKEFSRRGGLKILEKYGRGYFATIGSRGAKSKLKKYGPEYFKKLSVLGVAARVAKANARKQE